MKTPSFVFPKNFVWGVAAAATQIEGAADEDGKGPSIWDTFSRVPGKTFNGDTPAVACDHYHRYAADFRLMKKLGFRNYRLSVAWPRIFPNGTGAVNEKGLAFYDRLIDTMLENGITPWVTLYHWELPQALEDKGGWRVRSTAEAFLPFAQTVVKRLRDRVKNWMTLNEIPSFIQMSYGWGVHAPGATETPHVLNQCYHNALIAHGYGVQAVREFGGRGARVGMAHNPGTTVPIIETEPHIEAARQEYNRRTGHLMSPMFHGRYPQWFLRKAGADKPRIDRGDMELISEPTDFLALNLYGGSFVRAGKGGKPEPLQMSKGYPHANLNWLNILPQVLYWGPRFAMEQYGVKEIYISENGLSQDDELTPNGEVLDIGRREFYRNYLISLNRAIKEGVNIRGFFAWSFMDNYEWSEGYAKRFGIIYVDYATQKRTPKLSAQWYSKVIELNRVV
jgi:beta-glucosidase